MSGENNTNIDSESKSWPSMRLRALSIGIAAALLPLVLIGAIGAWNNSGTRVEDWLPAEFEETQQLLAFIDQFGSDELLMIGWDGATMGDEAMEQTRRALLAPDETDPQRRVFFREAWSGDSVLNDMLDPPLELTRRQALGRMKGWMLGDDGDTAILVLVSDAGIADRHAAISFARRVTSETLNRSADEIRYAGTSIEVVAIDEASKSSLIRLNGYSFLVCMLLLVLCLRRVWYAIVIFGIAFYAEQSTMALIHFSGQRMDSILLLTVNLTLVLSIAAGIHMFGYFRESMSRPGPGSPAWDALRTAFMPTLFAAITTAIGFGSLSISPIVPIHKFGFYTAVAVPISALLTLWYLAMYLPRRKPVVAEAHAVNSTPARQLRWLKAWPAIVSSCVIMIALGAWGASKLTISTGIHDLFPEDAKLLDDYAWLEQRIGPLVPIEVVLTIPKDEDRDVVDEMRMIGFVQGRLRKASAVGSTISAINFAPPIPPAQQVKTIGSMSYRSSLNARLKQSLQRYQALRLFRDEPNDHVWRVTARVDGSKTQDFVAIMDELKQVASDAVRDAGLKDVTFVLSGGVPLAAKTQQRLLTDIASSYFTALLLITATLALVLRNPLAGAIAMIPNVVPAACVFGIMGAFDMKIEIGGVMTASAVLGIAVDDSLHLILAFRECFQHGMSRAGAVSQALRTCAPAITQTTLVCGLGMLVFSLSPFVPIQRFAWLMFALMSIALLADLFVLPAILYSPLGKFFVSSLPKQAKAP